MQQYTDSSIYEVDVYLLDETNEPDAFDRWLDTFTQEKNLDLTHSFEDNITLDEVIAFIKASDKNAKDHVKTTLVTIDVYNGDVMHFFSYVANQLAAMDIF